MATKKNVPIIAVLNMKGGVGKTTVSGNVFRVLFARLRKRVLLLDLDPQFNLTQALFTRADYEQQKLARKTILSVMEPPNAGGLFDVKAKGSPVPKAEDIGKMLWHFIKEPDIALWVVPGDFGLVKYSLMDDNNQLTKARKRFLEFVADARKRFDVICIDCNPSSSFFTICALEACTHLLVPVRPDRYSILGLEMLSDFVAKLPSINPKPQTVILLNGVPSSGYDPNIENTLRAHPTFGPLTLANKLYASRLLLATPDYTGFATDKRAPYKDVLLARISSIVDELGPAFGLS